ncbi:redoxin family protein [Novosphingobium sp. FSY-8]|uniref:Redoxin family protein n=1 Tax=Novosphingobium ovatum TaxID=1908523 RepID=A0ABW9XD87_9SPHN|nr:TlpA disulfide reductase family protein [Novosphingobium ovatum]NBC36457.1 redoxin family protein [Novosphingobium ovatum]
MAGVAGCDRQSGGQAQPPAAASSAPDAAAKGGEAGVIDRSHKGEAMPDLSFADASGKSLGLTSLKGRPVLLNLWATWCAPCVAELPTLDALAGQAGGPQVITIAQDMGDASAVGPKIAAFLRDKGLNRLGQWIDPDNTLAGPLAFNTLPMTVLYDAQGHEVWRMVGPHDWSAKDAAALLAEAK